MTSQKIKGWTNVSPVDKDGLGRKMVKVCQDQQHTECEKEGKCYLMRPQCQVDKLRMVGKKFSLAPHLMLPEVTPEDLQKIDRMLRAGYEQCHRVEVTIREMGKPARGRKAAKA